MAWQKHTKIFTVFSFLRLKSPDIVWYQWIYPTAIFVLLFGGYYWFGKPYIGFDEEKLIGSINSFLGILVGFYIAALAAVSSFSNDNLDKIMKGRAPSLSTIRQGQEIKETLTRRRFLAILFGYCAIVSIISYIFGVLQLHLSVAQNLPAWVQSVSGVASMVAWGAYMWLLSSLLVVTLLGLHYLVERMHRA